VTTIAVILASTRPGRLGQTVAGWVLDQARQRTDATFDLVDLADYHLRAVDEPVPPARGHYTHDHTRQWAAVVARYDGYLSVTPEYNHAMPDALKNAIDRVYRGWNNKAAGFVSYGNQRRRPRRGTAPPGHGSPPSSRRDRAGVTQPGHRVHRLHPLHIHQTPARSAHRDTGPTPRLEQRAGTAALNHGGGITGAPATGRAILKLDNAHPIRAMRVWLLLLVTLMRRRFTLLGLAAGVVAGVLHRWVARHRGLWWSGRVVLADDAHDPGDAEPVVQHPVEGRPLYGFRGCRTVAPSRSVFQYAVISSVVSPRSPQP
jgi:hypothetical protein